MLFRKIGLAITFSPTGKALLAETKRLSSLFNTTLTLIHVGEKNETTEARLEEIIASAGIKHKTKLVWKKGDPAKAILEAVKEENIDLLVAGALDKEGFFGYYIGSVARKLMRKAECSVLILSNPQEIKGGFTKFVAVTDYSSEGENTVRLAREFAGKENAKELYIIREYQAPGLAYTVSDSGSMREVETTRQEWQTEEEDKLKFYIKELNLDENDIKIIPRAVFGKPGWAANLFTKEVKADILAISHPRKGTRFFDRIFTHDFEFSIKELHSSLLIVS